MVISRAGTDLDKLNPKSFGKVMEMLLCSHVHLRSLMRRIHIYINIFTFNQTIVSHSFVLFTHRDFTKCLVMEIWCNVLEGSWKGHGNPLVNMCMNPE